MAERLDGDTVLARLRELPGGPELLRAAAGHEDVELVGGAVRDVLLGRVPRELDVVVADDAAALAGELALSLGTVADVSEHERFGTALVSWQGGRIDIATRRAERYPAPGALPTVRAGTWAEDLQRRDFTVNAIAVGLGAGTKGEFRAPEHALEDLRHGVLRLLHDESFRDDPTRLHTPGSLSRAVGL